MLGAKLFILRFLYCFVMVIQGLIGVCTLGLIIPNLSIYMAKIISKTRHADRT